jgi:hypothetical protein
MWIQRKCSDSAAAAIPDCVRFDVIEAYAGSVDSLQGVIPLTFQGSKNGYLDEVPATPEIVADADRVARAVHRRVFRPEPQAPLSPLGNSKP